MKLVKNQLATRNSWLPLNGIVCVCIHVHVFFSALMIFCEVLYTLEFEFVAG